LNFIEFYDYRTPLTPYFFTDLYTRINGTRGRLDGSVLQEAGRGAILH